MQRKSLYTGQHIFIFDYRNRFRRCNAQTFPCEIFGIRKMYAWIWLLVRILDEFAKGPCDRGPVGRIVGSRFVSVSVTLLIEPLWEPYKVKDLC